MLGCTTDLQKHLKSPGAENTTKECWQMCVPKCALRALTHSKVHGLQALGTVRYSASPVIHCSCCALTPVQCNKHNPSKHPLPKKPHQQPTKWKKKTRESQRSQQSIIVLSRFLGDSQPSSIVTAPKESDTDTSLGSTTFL